MFENIGGKIITLAKILCWIRIIANIIIGIVLIAHNEGYFLAGLLFFIVLISFGSGFLTAPFSCPYFERIPPRFTENIFDGYALTGSSIIFYSMSRHL